MSAAAFIFEKPINKDGVLYLETAKAFIDGGIFSALQLYSWPFFSILVAELSKWSTLSLVASAFILNNVFIAGITFLFVALLKRCHANKATLFWGALTILLYTKLNYLRNEILRDPGYLFFLLLALHSLLSFQKTERFKEALLWNISLIFAIFFRNEGIFFFLLPLALGLTNKNLFLVWGKIFSIPIIGGICSTIAIISSSHLTDIFKHKTFSIYQTIQEHLFKHIHNIQRDVLNHYSVEFGGYIFIAIIFTLLIGYMIKSTSVFYLISAIYSFKKELMPLEKKEKTLLYFFIFLCLLVLIAFLSVYLFLDFRYLLPLSLIILLWAPSTFADLSKNKKWLFFFIAIFSLIAVETLHHYSKTKTEIIHAGRWIDKNTSKNIKVFSNDYRLSFYANRPSNRPVEMRNFDNMHLDIFFEKNIHQIREQFQIVILRIEENHEDFHNVESKLENIFEVKVLKHFKLGKKEKILIFQLNNSS